MAFVNDTVRFRGKRWFKPLFGGPRATKPQYILSTIWEIQVYIMYIYTHLSVDKILLYALNCEHVCHPALGTRTCLLHVHVCVCVCVFIVNGRSDDCCVPCLGDWIVIVVRKGLVQLED